MGAKRSSIISPLINNFIRAYSIFHKMVVADIAEGYGIILFNLYHQESPPSKRRERWEVMEEEQSDMIAALRSGLIKGLGLRLRLLGI